MTIAIEGGLIVAFDGKKHRLLRDGIIIIEGDRIKHVGKTYSGGIEERIDARGKLIVPGFINTHSHISASPNGKLFRGDGSSRQFYNTDLIEYLFNLRPTSEEAKTIAEFSIVEMLKSGNTTIIDMGLVDKVSPQEAVSLVGGMGIRAYLLKGHVSGKWYTTDGTRVEYENFDGRKWNEEPGIKKLEESITFIKEFNGVYQDRIKSLLYPEGIDDCSPRLLRETREAANKLKVGIETHAAQSVCGFEEIMRRYGKTQIGFLKDIGFLGSDVILGHAVMVSGHSRLPYTDPWEKDIKIISETGTSIAHCPTVFSRYGIALESYSKYLRNGINVSIGTDTFPQDIIREMGMAATISKIIERESSVATAGDVFNSATIMGAKALGREDIGRIESGAKADISIINLKTFNMTPVRDPIKNLIMSANSSDVETVFVDGKKLVENGEVKGVKEKVLLEKVQKVAEKVWERFSDYHWNHKTLEELKPQTFQFWDGS